MEARAVFDSTSVESRARTCHKDVGPFEGLAQHLIVKELPSTAKMRLCWATDKTIEFSKWMSDKGSIAQEAEHMNTQYRNDALLWAFSFVQIRLGQTEDVGANAVSWNDALLSTVSEFWVYCYKKRRSALLAVLKNTAVEKMWTELDVDQLHENVVAWACDNDRKLATYFKEEGGSESAQINGIVNFMKEQLTEFVNAEDAENMRQAGQLNLDRYIASKKVPLGRAYANSIFPTPETICRLFSRKDNTMYGSVVRQGLAPDLLTLIAACCRKNPSKVQDKISLEAISVDPFVAVGSRQGAVKQQCYGIGGFSLTLGHSDDGLLPDKSHLITVVHTGAAYLVSSVDVDNPNDEPYKYGTPAPAQLLATLDRLLPRHRSEYHGQLTSREFDALVRKSNKLPLGVHTNDVNVEPRDSLSSEALTRQVAFPVNQNANRIAQTVEFGRLQAQTATEMTRAVAQRSPEDAQSVDRDDDADNADDDSEMQTNDDADGIEIEIDDEDDSNNNDEDSMQLVADADNEDSMQLDVEADGQNFRANAMDIADFVSVYLDEVESIAEGIQDNAEDAGKLDSTALTAALKNSTVLAKTLNELRQYIKTRDLTSQNIARGFIELWDASYFDDRFATEPYYVTENVGRVRKIHVTLPNQNTKVAEISKDIVFPPLYVLQFDIPTPAYCYPTTNDLGFNVMQHTELMQEQIDAFEDFKFDGANETDVLSGRIESSLGSSDGEGQQYDRTASTQWPIIVAMTSRRVEMPDNSDPAKVTRHPISIRIPMVSLSATRRDPSKAGLQYNAMPLVSLVEVGVQLPLSFQDVYTYDLKKELILQKWFDYAVTIESIWSYTCLRTFTPLGSPYVAQKTPHWTIYPPPGTYEFVDPRRLGHSAIVRRIFPQEVAAIAKVSGLQDVQSMWHVVNGIKDWHWNEVIQGKAPGVVVVADMEDGITLLASSAPYRHMLACPTPNEQASFTTGLCDLLAAFLTKPVQSVIDWREYAEPLLSHFVLSGFAPIGAPTAADFDRKLQNMYAETLTNNSVASVKERAKEVHAALKQVANQYQLVAPSDAFASRERDVYKFYSACHVDLFDLHPECLFPLAGLLDGAGTTKAARKAQKNFFVLYPSAVYGLKRLYAVFEEHRQIDSSGRKSSAKKISLRSESDMQFLLLSCVRNLSLEIPFSEDLSLRKQFADSWHADFGIVSWQTTKRDKMLTEEDDMRTIARKIAYTAQLARTTLNAIGYEPVALRQISDSDDVDRDFVVSFSSIESFYQELMAPYVDIVDMIVAGDSVDDADVVAIYVARVQVHFRLRKIEENSYVTNIYYDQSVNEIDPRTRSEPYTSALVEVARKSLEEVPYYSPSIDLIYRLALRGLANISLGDTMTRNELATFVQLTKSKQVAPAIAAVQLASQYTQMLYDPYRRAVNSDIDTIPSEIDDSEKSDPFIEPETIEDVFMRAKISMFNAGATLHAFCVDVIDCLIRGTDLPSGTTPVWNGKDIDLTALRLIIKRERVGPNDAALGQRVPWQRLIENTYYPLENSSPLFAVQYFHKTGKYSNIDSWATLFDTFPNLRNRWASVPMVRVIPISAFPPSATLKYPRGDNTSDTIQATLGFMYEAVVTDATSTELFDYTAMMQELMSRYTNKPKDALRVNV